MRAICFLLASVILAGLMGGCSDDTPAPTVKEANSEAILKKDCSNTKWREQNLGLWYSVCRQPLRW
jgi:hypothetical protein